MQWCKSNLFLLIWTLNGFYNLSLHILLNVLIILYIWLVLILSRNEIAEFLWALALFYYWNITDAWSRCQQQQQQQQMLCAGRRVRLVGSTGSIWRDFWVPISLDLCVCRDKLAAESSHKRGRWQMGSVPITSSNCGKLHITCPDG